MSSLLSASLVVIGFLCGAGLAAPGDAGFPQTPSISPDGELVVFSWAGDLWAVDSDGGIASRLTSHPAHEGRSAFSPDGETLAFESDRDGAQNLYTMRVRRVGGAVVGTDIERVTISDRPQSLGGFSADGKELYYSASRDPEIYRHARMYAAPIGGGPVGEVGGAFGLWPRATVEGEVLFTRGYGSIWNRPNYRGPGTMDVWRLNTDGSFDRLTSFAANDGDAFGLDDGSVVFVSSRDGQNNLYRLAAGATDGGREAGDDLEQLTDFGPGDRVTIAHGVRDPHVALGGDVAVFCVWDTMYTLDLSREGAEPRAVEVTVSEDFFERDYERRNLSGDVDEAALSPDGKAMAVIARGEVFVRSVEDGRPTRRVTDTAARERDLVWSPDGKWLYFSSDAAGNWDIVRAGVTLVRGDIRPEEEEEPEVEESGDEAEPAGGGAAPGGDDGVSGEWLCEASGSTLPPGAGMFSLNLTLEGESISGSINVPGILDSSLSGTYDPESGKAILSVDAEDGSITMELTIADNALTGTVQFGGGELEIRGTREVAAAQPAAETPEEGEEESEDAEEKEEEEPKVDFGHRWATALRFDIEPVVEGETNDHSPLPSPDGRSIAFIRGRGELMLLDLASGEARTLLDGWDEPEARWLGDSRHMVFARADLDFNTDIWLLDTARPDAAPVNITRHPDIDREPRISHDGKVLVFLSDREGQNGEFDVWQVFLDRELEDLNRYEMDERFKKRASDAAKHKPIDPPALDKEAEEAPELDLDLEGAYLRVRRITSYPGSERSLEMTPGGDRILYGANVDGTYALWSVDHRGQERKMVTAGGVGDLRMMPDGRKISYVANSTARTANAGGGGAESYPIDAPVIIDIAAQQKQKFLEAMRLLGEGFYHPTMKGLDWDALTDAYLDLAMQTRTSDGFNRVGNLMLGELDGSHLGIRGGGGFSGGSESIGHLGVEAEPVEDGYRVTRVLDGSPAAASKSRIEVGETIVAIRGQDLAGEGAMPNIDLRTALMHTEGQEIIVDVVGEDGERRMVLIEPISFGRYSNLAYEQEVLDRRAMVEELSGGRLGYLHIEGMSEPSVRDFERDLYAAAEGKDGLIIDVRDNGGGWTTDILLASLTAPRHAVTVPRGASKREAFPDSYPRDRRLIYAYHRPISVLINQHSFSNAEIFAHAIKTIGRGRLVGTQTFGGVISTGGARLIDGTFVRMPFRGWYLPDGTDMEHNGAKPDIDVAQTPADEAAGRDPQLEAAVEELLKRVDRSVDGLWRWGE